MRYLALALTFVFAPSLASAQQQWSTVKGQVVWDAKNKAPDRKPIDLVKHPQCAAQNPPLRDDLLIDAKTGGIKDVMVWLLPEGNGPLAIHPDLKKVPDKEVVIDQPCCLFEPRVTMMRAGQVLVVKNSAGFSHNVHLSPGIGGMNPDSNTIVPSKGEKRFEKDKLLIADPFPVKIACDIHGHMGGRIGVFDHPYYAVTDKDGKFEIKNAPVGKVRIIIWHEYGHLHQPRFADHTKKVGGKYGQPITIPAAEALDLGKITMPPDLPPKN